MFEPADFLEESLLWTAQVLTGAGAGRPGRARRGRERLGRGGGRRARPGGPAPARCRPRAVPRPRPDGGARGRPTRDEGFAAEDEALADLICSDEFRSGVYAFDLVQRRAKRPAGVPDSGLARPVTMAGVVGAGLMASQLALLLVQRLEVPVVLTDLDQARVDAGVARVHGEIDGLLGKHRISHDRANRLKALVTGSTSIGRLRRQPTS